jgi:heme exporter protein CcmD
MEPVPHLQFIAAAYAAGGVVIAALVAWVTLDYRIQRRILTDLERHGVSRRSTPVRETAEQPAEEHA